MIMRFRHLFLLPLLTLLLSVGRIDKRYCAEVDLREASDVPSSSPLGSSVAFYAPGFDSGYNTMIRDNPAKDYELTYFSPADWSMYAPPTATNPCARPSFRRPTAAPTRSVS